jgi:pyridoxal biosynthesis lyase PdxS
MDFKLIVELSKGLGSAMDGIDVRKLDESEMLSTRGW